jgi:RNA polymerase sigma-70 factor (ECF subfamily)
VAEDNSPSIEDQDAELLQAVREAREGDLQAFELLMERYQRRILADCRYLTRDENNSEDLAQEVFVKAFFAIRQFEGRSSFRHWLQRIKVHHCLNHLKKRRGKDESPIDEESSAGHEQLQVPAAVEHALEAEGRRRKIGEILNSLPETLRIPLVMCDMDELSYDEIAAALGIGLSATKMRIKRAREQFRLLYGANEMQAQS